MVTLIGRLAKWRGSYGFIRYKDQDVFVHLSNYLHGFVPEINQLVEFELGPPNKEGMRHEAYRVRVVKTADQVIAEFNQSAGVNALLGGQDAPK